MMIGVQLARRLKKFSEDKRGSVSVIFAVATVPLVVATGFAVDNARMAQQETELQNALDSAVTAAASFVGSPADFRIGVAETYMAANFNREFAEGPVFVVDGNTVSGSARLAVPLAFMPIIGIDYGKVVGAASAEGVPGATVCMLALGPDADEGVRLIGTTALEAINCAVHTNSASATALHAVGGASGDADAFCAVGGYIGEGFHPTPITCGHVDDPFILPLPANADADCDFTDHEFKNGVFVAEPGVYCGGLDVRTHATVTMDPGVYIMRGGPLELFAHSELSGVGVTIYFYGEGTYINQKSGSKISLVAPTGEDVYAGVAITQHPESSVGETNILAGGPDVHIVGSFHTPTQILDIRGGANWAISSGYFPMVADSFILRGNATMTVAADHEAAGYADQLARIPGGVRLTN